MICLFLQSDSQFGPGVTLELCGSFATCGVLEDTLVVQAVTACDLTVGIEDDSCACGKSRAEVHTELGPTVIVCIDQLQCVFAAICRSGDAGIGIADSCQDGIVGCALTGEQTGVVDGVVEVYAAGEAAFNHCEVIHVDRALDWIRTARGHFHIQEQIHILRITGQCHGNSVPCATSEVHCSVTAAGGCAVLKLRLIVSAQALDIHIDLEGNDGTGLHSAIQVNSEGRICEPVLAQLQSVFATVSRLHDAVGFQFFIGSLSDGEVVVLISLAGEQAFIARFLKTNNTVPVAKGSNCRQDSLEVIDIQGNRAGLRDEIVNLPVNINIGCSRVQCDLDGQPCFVACKLRSSCVSANDFKLVAGYPAAIVDTVCHKADHGTGRQGLTEVKSGGHIIAAVGQRQTEFTAVCGRGDALFGILKSHGRRIRICIVGCAKERHIAALFKAQAVNNVALAFGLNHSEVVDIDLTGGGSGGDTCTFDIPEQVHIISVLGQQHTQLCPLVAGKLRSSGATIGVLENALVILGRAAGDPAVGVKFDFCACGKRLTEVDPDGGIIVAVMAQLHRIAAAVSGSGNACICIGHSLNDSIALHIALTDKQVLLSTGLIANAAIVVIVGISSALAILVNIADQVVDVQSRGNIVLAFLMVQEFKDYKAQTVQGIEVKACHDVKIIGTGGPAIGSQRICLLVGGNVAALTDHQTNSDLLRHGLRIVNIKGDALVAGEIGMSSNVGDRSIVRRRILLAGHIQLDVGVLAGITVVALGLHLQGGYTLTDISGIRVDLHVAQHVAHRKLYAGVRAGDLRVVFKA